MLRFFSFYPSQHKSLAAGNRVRDGLRMRARLDEIGKDIAKVLAAETAQPAVARIRKVAG